MPEGHRGVVRLHKSVWGAASNAMYLSSTLPGLPHTHTSRALSPLQREITHRLYGGVLGLATSTDAQRNGQHDQSGRQAQHQSEGAETIRAERATAGARKRHMIKQNETHHQHICE